MSIILCDIFRPPNYFYRKVVFLIYSKIKDISKKKKIPICQIEKELGFSNGSICKWDKNNPSVEKVSKVAKYLGVKIEDIIL